MTFNFGIFVRFRAFAFCSLVFLTAETSVSFAEQSLPEGWFKACTNQNDVDVCNVQNVLTADTGQIVTSISLIELKGKLSRKFLQIMVPSARLIPPGILLQVDTAKAQKLDYMVCLPDRCIAEMALTDSIISSFKKGGAITLTSFNFQNHPNPVKLSLQGFATTFDGPALKQSDIDDREKKIQDFVTRNNEIFSKKLKEEQDKVKKVD